MVDGLGSFLRPPSRAFLKASKMMSALIFAPFLILAGVRRGCPVAWPSFAMVWLFGRSSVDRCGGRPGAGPGPAGRARSSLARARAWTGDGLVPVTS